MIPKATENTYFKEAITSKFLNIQFLFLFLVFPLSQVINMFLLAQALNALYGLPLPAVYTLAAIILFLLIFILFLLQKQHAKKQNIRDYNELLNIQQYQKKHYETIKKQRSQLECLKNEFNLQMTSITEYLDNNQHTEALELLQTLTKNLEATREYPFCPNSVINAVLSDKERICQEHQISFHTDLQIGPCVSIDKLHLCSIFSNLLDNALEASKHIEPKENRYIFLTARQSGDYLHIKVKNAALPPSSPKQGHGYGQKILKDIAEKYSGNFRTQYNNNTYEAYLSIQMP